MIPATLVLTASASTAILAVVLSLRGHQIPASRVARIALFLALGAVPAAIAIMTLQSWIHADDTVPRAAILGGAISRAMNYGIPALACAAVADFARRRARRIGRQ